MEFVEKSSASMPNDPINIDDIIARLGIMVSISTNSLLYLDQFYTNPNEFQLSDKTLAEIKRLELNVNSLETTILQTIYQGQQPGSEQEKKYAEYVKINKRLVSEQLFYPKKAQEILDTAKQMDAFFEGYPEVAALVEERNGYLNEIQQLDRLKEENVVFRYKRIYLQRREKFYSFMLSQIVLNKDKYNDFVIRQEIADLLNKEKDFAVYEFEAIAAKVIAIPMVVQSFTDESDDIVNRKIEDIRQWEKELSEKDKEFKKKFIDIKNFEDKDVEEYKKYVSERDALRYGIEAKRSSLTNYQRFKLNAQEQKFSAMSKDFGKMVLADIASTVTSSLLKTIKGEADEVDWEGVALEVGEAILKAGVQVVAAAYLGPFGAQIAGSIFSAFLPGPPDPVLQKIGIMMEQLNQIEEKLDQLTEQMNQFQKDITSMIQLLPAKIADEMTKLDIQKDIQEIKRQLLNNKNNSQKIINNSGGSLLEYNNLINNSGSINNLIQQIIQKTYALISLQPDEYDLPESPGDGTLIWHFIGNNLKDTHPLDFYSSCQYILNVHQKLTEDVFEMYLLVQPIVEQALSIYYTMGYNDQNTINQDKIVTFLMSQYQKREDTKAMFYNLKIKLLYGMVGARNLSLYEKMQAYEEPGADYNFDFTKGFGLLLKSNDTDKGTLCEYDYNRQLFQKSSSDAPGRFYIQPGFTTTEDNLYDMYYANNDCSPGLLKAKVLLGFRDTIYIVGTTSGQFSVVPFSDPLFKDSIEQLFLNKVRKLIQISDRTIIKLPLSSFYLVAYCTQAGEYCIDLVEEPTKQQTTLVSKKFVPSIYESKYILFESDALGYYISIESAAGDKITQKLTLSIRRARLLEGEKTDHSRGLDVHTSAITGNPYIVIDNRYLFSYLPASSKDTLVPGQRLYKGDGLFSENGKYKMIFENSGNFSLYAFYQIGNKEGKNSLYTTNTDGLPYFGREKGQVLIMQRDGRIKMYNEKFKVIWQTDYISEPCKGLQIVNDGSAVLHYQGSEKFDRYLRNPSSTDRLGPAEYLLPGESLKVSDYDRTKAVFEENGDFVIYSENGAQLWTSGTKGLGIKMIVMETDGTLGFYDGSGKRVKEYKGPSGASCILSHTEATYSNRTKLVLSDGKSRDVIIYGQ